MKTASESIANSESATPRRSFFKKPAEQSFFQNAQTKLTVGRAGDKYEVEADTMADKVVQRLQQPSTESSTPFFQSFQGNIALQSKCDSCEDEVQTKTLLNIQSKAEDASSDASLESQLSSSKGSGSSLPEPTKNQMESSFGADFGNVKVHTDTNAVAMNQSLNAQAFTHGNDVYFNEGKYDTSSSGGQHLLAHELTHTVQQGAAVQKKEQDKHDLTARLFSGDEKLEACFDGDNIVKQPAQGEHVLKLQQALQHLGIVVPGFAINSKYDAATSNAVRDFQIKAGMSIMERDGIIGKKTLGLLDMSLRDHAIAPDTDLAADNFTVTDDQQKKKDEACKGKPIRKTCEEEFFTTVVDPGADAAVAMIDKVLTEQLPPIKNKKADYPSLFSQIFRNNDNRPLADTVQDVRAHYITIKEFVKKLKTDRSHVRCATECDGGCRSGSPAYHRFERDVNKHVIIFCPEFEKHPQRTEIVLHESHHASIPDSGDKAYASTRLFDKLDHKTALLNAASFHAYAAWVVKPGSEKIGPDIKDTNLINDANEKDRVDLALGHMHQWFSLIDFDISRTVQGVQEAHDLGVYKSNNAEIYMKRVFSKWFELTSPPTPPTELDIQKLKAIEERVIAMKEAFKSPFIILETPDNSFWERGPGSGIALNDEVLQLDLDHMIIALLQELTSATLKISAELEPMYVLTINDMRNLRDLDP